MTPLLKGYALIAAVMITTQSAIAGQYVVELSEPLDSLVLKQMTDNSIALEETLSAVEILSAGAGSYAVFSAADEAAVESFLDAFSFRVEKISEVLFINSPAVSGGQPAGEVPRAGHDVFVIERPIPGVGFLGLEKKQLISQNSNTAITKLGEVIEWDHSYLTSDGTYCVYRADSPETLREHGALAGAPIGKITRVLQESH
ncbi:MAG: nickel-binding protein [Boseongicola sp.]